jgi:hypothetical protein
VTRVEIDLNVRVRGNWTFSGLEDADGPLVVGEIVEVYERESGFAGRGRVEEVDEQRRVVFLSVDWGSLRAADVHTARDRRRPVHGVELLGRRGPDLAGHSRLTRRHSSLHSAGSVRNGPGG